MATTVTMRARGAPGSTIYEPDQTYDLDDDEAIRLVAAGFAEFAPPSGASTVNAITCDDAEIAES